MANRCSILFPGWPLRGFGLASRARPPTLGRMTKPSDATATTDAWALAAGLLVRWLSLFHVTPRHDLELELSAMADALGAKLEFERPFCGYAQYGVLKLPIHAGRP